MLSNIDPSQALLEHRHLLGWNFLGGELRILALGVGQQLIKLALIARELEKLIDLGISDISAFALL